MRERERQRQTVSSLKKHIVEQRVDLNTFQYNTISAFVDIAMPCPPPPNALSILAQIQVFFYTPALATATSVFSCSSTCFRSWLYQTFRQDCSDLPGKNVLAMYDQRVPNCLTARSNIDFSSSVQYIRDTERSREGSRWFTYRLRIASGERPFNNLAICAYDLQSSDLARRTTASSS